MNGELLEDYDYELPENLIAQSPASERSGSRLLHLRRSIATLGHRRFSDLPELLRAGDLLVLNNTRVIPARILGRKESGGAVEIFLTRMLANGRFEAIFHMSGKPRPGLRILAGPGAVVMEEDLGAGLWLVRLDDGGAGPEAFLELAGRVPLPPYIKRDGDDAYLSPEDRERYQTVYARHAGAVAAPTAGLHFSDEVFAELEARGVKRAFVTLHVGLGTFHTPKENGLDDIRLHREDYILPDETVAAIDETRAQGGRVIAVGTTSVRVIESARRCRQWYGHAGATELFIRPGRDLGGIDAMITNFHLPRSTLLVLVAAFCGRERILQAYREAVRERYRFFSYGDAMFIE